MGATLDGIRDVALVARELHGLEHLGQELAGAADEGQALRVLVGARALADHDELGARVAGAEDDGVPRVAELAARASLQRGLLPTQRFLRSQQIVAAQRELSGAHVSMMAQRAPKRVERLRQRRPRRVAQRTTRSGVARAAARRVRM